MRLAALAPLVLAGACGTASPGALEPGVSDGFGGPRPVSITGYAGDAMEPFLSRDGSVLFFNNSNTPDAQTDLHWAERKDDLTFRYRGLVRGANSPALDAVATMSATGLLCFVSTRSYFETLGSVYCGKWRDGAVTDLALQDRLSLKKLGRLVFDVELSRDGEIAVFADGTFSGGPVPDAADLRLARRDGAGYRYAPEDERRLAAVNTGDLEYAAALSPDGKVLAFTRASKLGPVLQTSVWISRLGNDGTFGPPQRISAISGEAAEAPTFSPDGRALYYHVKVGGRYAIRRVSR